MWNPFDESLVLKRLLALSRGFDTLEDYQEAVRSTNKGNPTSSMPKNVLEQVAYDARFGGQAGKRNLLQQATDMLRNKLNPAKNPATRTPLDQVNIDAQNARKAVQAFNKSKVGSVVKPTVSSAATGLGKATIPLQLYGAYTTGKKVFNPEYNITHDLRNLATSVGNAFGGDGEYVGNSPVTQKLNENRIRAKQIREAGGIEKYKQLFPDADPGGYKQRSAQDGQYTLSPGIHERVDREIAALKANEPLNIIRRSVPKPTGTGTQAGYGEATPDQMLAFLGAIRNQAGANQDEIDQGRITMQFARPYQEESVNTPVIVDATETYRKEYPLDVPYAERTAEDLDYYAYTPEEKKAFLAQRSKGTSSALKEGNKKSKKEQEPEEKAEQKNWMVPYRDEKAMARAAFLDAPDSMTGLKRREAMKGFITAGGKKYAITPEFIKSNDPKDLGRVLSSDEVARAKAQEFLNETLNEVKQTPSESQNPVVSNESTAEKMTPGQRKMFPLGKGVTFADTDNESVQQVTDFWENNGNAYDFEKATERLSGYMNNYSGKSYF